MALVRINIFLHVNPMNKAKMKTIITILALCASDVNDFFYTEFSDNVVQLHHCIEY